MIGESEFKCVWCGGRYYQPSKEDGMPLFDIFCTYSRFYYLG